MSMPPCYCIWNREIPRREITENHFKNFGLDVNFIEGIYGHGFNLRAKRPTSKKADGTDWFISSGHIGLCLSHYMVWTLIWHAGHEEAIVFEDDAFLTTTFHQDFRQVRRDLPNDWEVCYIGWLHNHERQRRQIRNKVYKIDGCPFGTHAMFIRRAGIRKLLDTQREFMQHIDINIHQRSLPHMNDYYVYPSIVTQRSQNGKKDKPAAFHPTV